MNTTPDVPKASDSKKRASSSKQLSLRWAIRDERVMQWLNRADLARISGEEGRYLELLERAGIESVAELALCDPADLLATLSELNRDEKLVPVLPDEIQLRRWIEKAGTMADRGD